MYTAQKCICTEYIEHIYSTDPYGNDHTLHMMKLSIP
jgi:hypothetical protein